MKNIFAILLICSAAFVYANEKPKNSDDEGFKSNHFFSRCDDDQDECDGNHEPGKPRHDEEPKGLRFDKEPRSNNDEEGKNNNFLSYSKGLGFDKEPRSNNDEEGKNNNFLSYSSWSRYKTNFGMEKVIVRFPHDPIVTQTNTLLTVYAYDQAVLYSFTGYFPPIGNINPSLWFDELLTNYNVYPFTIMGSTIFQNSQGHWVMDYTVYDNVQNLVIKCSSFCTPFNGYTLQCVKPNGSKDYLDYFLDNFKIQCECAH